ncbi:TVP38/TMEM64 family protein [Gottfriedia luciferensis]|uniref:TVP38/TMEM64 family protein n=1 Tax=Gottfriedia luciferensis TaxID=178774 RepID=UPI000B44E521|nr:TVP38/TMEM64 family protein [Gottfriedia luciferensis]
MNVFDIKDFFTEQHFLHLIQQYKDYGPLVGISIPFLEAIFPVLPLVVFIFANAAAFGPLLGFLYSWIGSCLGSIFLFYLVRKYGQKRFFSFVSKHKKVESSIGWIEKRGFGPIFIMFAFPFSPSFLINIVAGLSRIKISQFLIALVLGKFTMIAVISYLGKDLTTVFQNPIKAIYIGIFIFVLWIVGKVIEKRMDIKEQTTEKKGTPQSSDEQ